MLVLSALTASAGHFITDAAYRRSVDSAFQSKMRLIGSKFFDTASLNVTEEESEALRFLYAYMPVADATDYSTAFHLGNIRYALKVRLDMPWGKDVPELLFRHFVLPVRVNNEPLDSFRAVYYHELSQRVIGLTAREAILEVNHWCHEHVTYEPSDARTSSPLQTIRTSRGRCGEESTLAVAALRSVGIPARQVYTPRWAHTDDNHAWVEAWADGKWWFIGACEPEPVLNLAWFNEPASRAMLTHTRVFGDYRGTEEVVLRASNFTEINLIGNYADTARADFLIVDDGGNPVDNACVEFKIYNYAEYYTAVTKYTGADGRTFLTAGKGDLLVWASKDGRFGYAKVSFGKDKFVRISLSADVGSIEGTEAVDIVPPVGHAALPFVPAEQRAENNRRLAAEDSMRNAYTSTFPTGESLRGYKFPDAIPYIIKSRGNWKTIEAFLDRYDRRLTAPSSSDDAADGHKLSLRLLSTVSDKDLRDMPMEILADNIDGWSSERGQICPRVEDEMIFRPFKVFLADKFSRQAADYRRNPQKLVDWVSSNITVNPDTLALSIPQTPVGVWESRVADKRSRDIFFVDAARSIGIEARKDAVTGKVQYRQGGKWIDVNFGQTSQASAKTGRLILRYTPTKSLDNPKYYGHFTISKLTGGRLQLLNFDEASASWGSTFRDGINLDEGTYMLVSGQRQADGSVLACNRFFKIEQGRDTCVELTMREPDEKVKVIGSFPSGARFMMDGSEVSILSQVGHGYYIIGVIATGQEPTNHALRDISKVKDRLDKWGRPLLLLFESEADAAKFDAADYGALPRNTIFGIDKDGAVLDKIKTTLLVNDSHALPVFLIADTFDRVVFASQGYTIGLGEQMLKTIIREE